MNQQLVYYFCSEGFSKWSFLIGRLSIILKTHLGKFCFRLFWRFHWMLVGSEFESWDELWKYFVTNSCSYIWFEHWKTSLIVYNRNSQLNCILLFNCRAAADISKQCRWYFENLLETASIQVSKTFTFSTSAIFIWFRSEFSSSLIARMLSNWLPNVGP